MVSLSSCAQSRNIIQAKAFFKQSIPGALLSETDMEGRNTIKAVDTLHFLYLQVSSSPVAPILDSIYIGQRFYKVETHHLMDKNAIIGNSKTGNVPIRLPWNKNMNWWKFNVSLVDGVRNKFSNEKKIEIKGHYKKQSFLIKIDKQIELQSAVRM